MAKLICSARPGRVGYDESLVRAFYDVLAKDSDPLEGLELSVTTSISSSSGVRTSIERYRVIRGLIYGDNN